MIHKSNGSFCHQVRCICSPSIGVVCYRHILLGLLISDIRQLHNVHGVNFCFAQSGYSWQLGIAIG